jgi:hypothetical protein
MIHDAKKRSCPVCGGGHSKVLFRQSFEQLSGVQFISGYEVVICEACGAGFADGIPPQSVFDDYYAVLSRYDYSDRENKEPPQATDRFVQTAAVLREVIPSRSSRMLEIGSGSGYSNVLASDPAAGCIRSATSLYGVPGIVGTVLSLPKPEVPYDFLILIGVMEHIRELDAVVARFHELISEQGRIYLEVPDASGYIPSLDAPFQEFSQEHINYFSNRSLNNLMHLRGFRCIRSGHALRPQYEVACPATYSVFERSAAPPALERDTETEAGLRAYIEGCREQDAGIREQLRGSLAPGERMIVWGVGSHTLRLLATGGLDAARIAAFVDSNPKYQQHTLQGVPVVAPGDLKGRPEPILISSRGYQSEIKHQIQDELRLANRLILLYPEARPEDR